jgi:TP901 family phage tail tape measure protein
MIVRKLEALFTINTNAVQFQKAASHLDNLAAKAQTVMSAIAGYWAVQALQNFVINTSNAMAELGKTSEYLGITANALQELRYAAEKSGVSMDALDDSLKELQVRAFDAKSGEGEAAEAFQTLGVKATDAAGRIREPLELLDEVADKFLKLPTHSDRLWVADAIFGDEGATVLKMLHEGSLGLHALRKEAKALGLTLDQETINKSIEFNANLKRLHLTSKSITNTFVSSLLPGLSWLTEKCALLSAAFNQVEHRASIVRVSLAALSVAVGGLALKLAIAFAPMLLKLSLIGGVVSAIAFLIDDLWVAFKGGDSVFLSLHKRARAFFEPLEQWVLNIPKAFLDGIRDKFLVGLNLIKDKFTAFHEWIVKIATNIKDNFAGLLPDFLKKGFAGSLKMAGVDVQHLPENLNTRLAPTASSISNQNRISSNQSVNVAVNVKSGADPHEISGAVSKAVRKELERERFNAFMGVNQYAG